MSNAHLSLGAPFLLKPHFRQTQATIWFILLWQVQHIKGLPKDWEGRKEKVVDQLFSRAPHYNKVRRFKSVSSSINTKPYVFFMLIFNFLWLFIQISKQYELDFRERGRAEVRIQRSVKNFQLTMGVLFLDMTQT